MAGSANPFSKFCLGIVQKKTLSFSSNLRKSASNPLSFSSKTLTLAPFSTPNPYRFPAFWQNTRFCQSKPRHLRSVSTTWKHDYSWDVRHLWAQESLHNWHCHLLCKDFLNKTPIVFHASLATWGLSVPPESMIIVGTWDIYEPRNHFIIDIAIYYAKTFWTKPLSFSMELAKRVSHRSGILTLRCCSLHEKLDGISSAELPLKRNLALNYWSKWSCLKVPPAPLGCPRPKTAKVAFIWYRLGYRLRWLQAFIFLEAHFP